MIYGNLAYKYDYVEEKFAKKNTKTEKKVNTKTVKKNKHNTNISYGGKIAMVFAIAVSAVFMIIQYVTVNETHTDLNEAKAQYQFEESVTAQKSFELEQSIDLSKIETEATSRLGMCRPEKHQIVYLDVKQSDATIKTANDVEGFANRCAAFWESVKSNIIEFFSI